MAISAPPGAEPSLHGRVLHFAGCNVLCTCHSIDTVMFVHALMM